MKRISLFTLFLSAAPLLQPLSLQPAKTLSGASQKGDTCSRFHSHCCGTCGAEVTWRHCRETAKEMWGWQASGRHGRSEELFLSFSQWSKTPFNSHQANPSVILRCLPVSYIFTAWIWALTGTSTVMEWDCKVFCNACVICFISRSLMVIIHNTRLYNDAVVPWATYKNIKS